MLSVGTGDGRPSSIGCFGAALCTSYEDHRKLPSPVISGKDRYARFLQVPLRSDYTASICFAEWYAEKIELFLIRSIKLTEKASDDLVLPAASFTWVELIAVR